MSMTKGSPAALALAERNRERTGWHHSEDARAKIAASQTGQVRSPETRAKMKAAFTREDSGYRAAHTRLRVARGPASRRRCVECGRQAQHWAFRHGTPPERVRAEVGGEKDGHPFSLDPMDYDPRCVKCHKKYDRRHSGGS